MYITVQMLRSLSVLCLAITIATITASIPHGFIACQTQVTALQVLRHLFDSDPPLPPSDGGSRVSPFS